MDEQKGISRRRMISGLGAAGIAALGGSRTFAAQERQEAMTTQPVEDPKTKYPRPGLASKMDPDSHDFQ
jgi:hypothetical protein